MLELLEHATHLEIDQFLEPDRYAGLRDYADRASYSAVENPADGVTYPGICAEIPEPIVDAVTRRLRLVRGADVDVHYLFLRLSESGVEAPQMVHSDESMGDYSLMLYLDDNVLGATAFVKHFEGEFSCPKNEADVVTIERDGRDMARWEVDGVCHFAHNRACIFAADRMHAAMPSAGYGSGPKDGRLVLTAFFS